MIDPNATNPMADPAMPPPPPTGYCQNCGRPLDRDTARIVGSAVYCEPCLAARLSGIPGGIPGTAPGYTPGYPPVDPGAPNPWNPPPAMPGAPNPGLAALLGFIPGVGAMYNEQYAKGIVHLIVFAVLVTLADMNGIFGLFIAGWEFYMAIEAHHTAKARRDGLPLPNPFGLNDIGERLGFGKAWPGTPDPAGFARDAAQAAAQTAAQNTASRSGGFGSRPDPASAAWDPASSSYAPPYSYAQPTAGQAAQEDARRYAENPGYSQAGYDAFGGQVPYTPVNPGSPFAQPPVVPPMTSPISRFPAGAVWLIGLGCLFLLRTTGIFRGFNTGLLFGFGLIGLGVWSFLRRMAESGTGLAYDGTPTYALRAFRALRLGAWLILVGIWMLLDSFHLLRMHNSWPLFVILAGVMTLLERVAYNSAATSAMYSSPASGPISTPPTTAGPMPPRDQTGGL